MAASADYLDVQIAELTKQKQEKIKILEECQKSNKGFKIAGLTTLGVSTIGVGVNIGEAIMLKGQKSDIADKEKQLDELDSKISSTKILIAENNTCGPSDCQGDGDTEAAKLNGAGPVCISNVWAVKSCNSGFGGRLKKCKRKGVEIEYYDACTKDTSFDTCGSDICNNEDKETVENRLNGKTAVCIQGNWAVKSCNSGFGGTLKKCKRKGVEIEYYDACTKDAAFNTCGSAECDESTKNSKVAELKGSGALCVNKEWTVRTCNTGYIGEKQQCTREGISYDYYFKCEPEAGFDSCGSSDCSDKGTSKDAESELHGRPAVCIDGNWAVKSCNANYSGTQEQCKRNGELITYYHQCIEQDGRNTCGSNNCTGSADSALNGAVPICVGDRWHVTVCNEGYSGQITTCTRDGVTYSYYANGCSKVIVPDGVTVKDLGNGEYAITIERGDKTTKKGGKTTNKGDKTTNKGDKTTNEGDSNSYTYYITPDGVIKRIDETPGEPGSYTYTTHNGDVYNIENVIIGGAGENDSGDINWNDFWNGRVPMPTGITGGGNTNLSIGVGGTSTIDFSRDFYCEDLSVSATSSNDSVTATVDGTILTIKVNKATEKPSTVDVTVKCGDQEQKFKYNVTVQVPEDININTTMQKPVSINFGSKTINLDSSGCASNIVVDAKSNNETVVDASVSGNNISLTYKKPGTAQVTVQVKCGDNILQEYEYNITVPDTNDDITISIIDDQGKGQDITVKKTTYIPGSGDRLKEDTVVTGGNGNDLNIENNYDTSDLEVVVAECQSLEVDIKDTGVVKKPTIRGWIQCSGLKCKMNSGSPGWTLENFKGTNPVGEKQYLCDGEDYLNVTDLSNRERVVTDSLGTKIAISNGTKCLSDCSGYKFEYQIDKSYKTGVNDYYSYNNKDSFKGCLNIQFASARNYLLNKCLEYCHVNRIPQFGTKDGKQISNSTCEITSIAIDTTNQKCLCNPTNYNKYSVYQYDNGKDLKKVAK